MSTSINSTHIHTIPDANIVTIGGDPYELYGSMLDISNKEEVIKYLANDLYHRSIVKEEYGAAVLAREKEFPTGLPTEPISVAIPHSDREYVYRPAIAIAKLKKPVVFNNMGDSEEELDVSLIFLLAVPHGREIVCMIQSLVELFQDSSVLINLSNANSGDELVEIVKNSCKDKSDH